MARGEHPSDRRIPGGSEVHALAAEDSQREFVATQLMPAIARVFRSGPEIQLSVGDIALRGNKTRVALEVQARDDTAWVRILLETMQRRYPTYAVSLWGLEPRTTRLGILSPRPAATRLDTDQPDDALRAYRRLQPRCRIQVHITP